MQELLQESLYLNTFLVYFEYQLIPELFGYCFSSATTKMESLWQGAVVGTWRMLTTHLRHIRVDFAQPFSLQVCQICYEN